MKIIGLVFVGWLRDMLILTFGKASFEMPMRFAGLPITVLAWLASCASRRDFERAGGRSAGKSAAGTAN